MDDVLNFLNLKKLLNNIKTTPAMLAVEIERMMNEPMFYLCDTS